MRCRGAVRMLSAHLDDRLNAAEEKALKEHLEACPACRAKLDGMRELLSDLRSLPRLEAPPLFREALAARLEGEAKPKERRKDHPNIARPVFSTRRLAFTLPAAAVVLGLFFGLYLTADARLPRIIIVQTELPPLTRGGVEESGEKGEGSETAVEPASKGESAGGGYPTEEAASVQPASIPELLVSLGAVIEKRKESRNAESLLVKIPVRQLEALFRGLRGFGTVELPSLSKKRLSSANIRLRLRITAAR